MKKKISVLLFFFAIACEVSIGEGGDNEENRGRGGCEIRLWLIKLKQY